MGQDLHLTGISQDTFRSESSGHRSPACNGAAIRAIVDDVCHRIENGLADEGEARELVPALRF